MANISLKELRQFTHRINPEERQGAYGYYLIRPFSLYLTYLALRLGLTANHVTVLQTLAGLAGAALLAFPSNAMALAGVLFLQFGFVLDNVDGEVARFRRQVSITGKFLDTIGHELVIPSMYFALGVGAYFRLGHFESVVFGFLAGLFSLRLDFATMYHEAAQFIETKLDQSYNYYSALKFGEAPKLYRRKNETSAVRLLYAIFAYPAIMNIITVLLLADIFLLPPLALFNYKISLVYLFLAIYGMLIPPRRVYTIWKLAKGREVERKYLTLIDLMKNQNKAASRKEEEADKQG